MNFISCVKWVKTGVAKSVPENVNLTEEELRDIISEANEAGENDDDNTVVESNAETGDEYDLKNYDEEDGSLRASLKGIVEFETSSKKKKKKKKKSDKLKPKRKLNDDLSDSEQEDELIKDDDNLLLVGHVDGDLSTIDVYVYNQAEGDMYIHHDMMLKSSPLCLEWLNVETESGLNNLCAVGLITPVIELWDLDMINCVEPVAKLGRFKKKNPEKNFGHTDAVLSVAWNSDMPHILCSGSVDETALLWDLDSGKVATEINVFTDKVQALCWNPNNSRFLLTGCADGHVRNFDCRYYDHFEEFDLASSVESLVWHPTNEFICFAGTEDGKIHHLDFRSNKQIASFQAHKKEVTGLALDQSNCNTLVSVSADEFVKIWDVQESPRQLYEKDFKLEAVHCIGTNPDYPFMACIGGSSERSNKKLMKVFNIQEFLQPQEDVHESDGQDLITTLDIPLLEDDQKSSKGKKPKVKTKQKKKPKTKKQKVV